MLFSRTNLAFIIKILLRYGVVDVFEPEDLMELRNIPKVDFPHCVNSSQYFDLNILDNNILDINILDNNITITQDENSNSQVTKCLAQLSKLAASDKESLVNTTITSN